jgi:hypothetical protein
MILITSMIALRSLLILKGDPLARFKSLASVTLALSAIRQMGIVEPYPMTAYGV